MKNTSNNYKGWPRVHVSYVNSNTPEWTQHIESKQWLVNNNIEYQVLSGFSVNYFTICIKDPKYMTMFRIKFPNMCRIVKDAV